MHAQHTPNVYERAARAEKTAKLVAVLAEAGKFSSFPLSEWVETMDAGTRRTAEIAAGVKPCSAETWRQVASVFRTRERRATQ